MILWRIWKLRWFAGFLDLWGSRWDRNFPWRLCRGLFLFLFLTKKKLVPEHDPGCRWVDEKFLVS